MIQVYQGIIVLLLLMDIDLYKMEMGKKLVLMALDFLLKIILKYIMTCFLKLEKQCLELILILNCLYNRTYYKKL